jgi:hypothetical protein
MGDPLNDIRWKLWRARKHHEALGEVVDVFLKSNFYRTAGKQDRNGRLVERVIEVDPPPPLWGVLVSDCAHQLRSVLDHLLFLLANPATEREETNLQFPICSTRKAWHNAQWRMPGTTRAVRSVIDELQPYHRRKWPETFVLAQLREINNWDKHRALLASTAFGEVRNLTATPSAGTSVRGTESFRGLIKPGALFSRVEMENSSHGDHVYVHRHLAKQAVFAYGTPGEIRGKPIRATLASIGNFIEGEVVPRFERLL